MGDMISPRRADVRSRASERSFDGMVRCGHDYGTEGEASRIRRHWPTRAHHSDAARTHPYRFRLARYRSVIAFAASVNEAPMHCAAYRNGLSVRGTRDGMFRALECGRSFCSCSTVVPFGVLTSILRRRRVRRSHRMPESLREERSRHAGDDCQLGEVPMACRFGMEGGPPT